MRTSRSQSRRLIPHGQRRPSIIFLNAGISEVGSRNGNGEDSVLILRIVAVNGDSSRDGSSLSTSRRSRLHLGRRDSGPREPTRLAPPSPIILGPSMPIRPAASVPTTLAPSNPINDASVGLAMLAAIFAASVPPSLAMSEPPSCPINVPTSLPINSLAKTSLPSIWAVRGMVISGSRSRSGSDQCGEPFPAPVAALRMSRDRR